MVSEEASVGSAAAPAPSAAAVVTFKPVSQQQNSLPADGDERREKEKLGHRRIDKQGEVSYKKVPTNALMAAIQLGIANSIGSLASAPNRDLLVQDFDVLENVAFPSIGSQTTPSHPYGDFRFKTYAPFAFRYFRKLFEIQTEDFLRSICTEPLHELSNAGASGSIFYVSADDKFIIKTVQHKEADFLQKLLPGYYMNLNQNPHTLLPKFFGLFCYQSLGKNIRLLVMNNLLPQAIEMHEKYDLKGSTYKRVASSKERAKAHPTLKDLDFLETRKEGIYVDPQAYDDIIKIITRDCTVLRSFKIMDYSLLVGVHNLEIAEKKALEAGEVQSGEEEEEDDDQPGTSRPSRSKQKLFLWETSIENGVTRYPARSSNGDRLILFLGIIDILQNYRLVKKLEHTWKAVLHDGDSISVHNPNFYAQRFLSFMNTHVFKRDTALRSGVGGKFRSLVHSYLALKQSPSRRRPRKSVGEEDVPVPSARGDQPAPTSQQRGVSVRRSYHKQEASEMASSRREKRLFASSRPEEREAMVEEEIVSKPSE